MTSHRTGVTQIEGVTFILMAREMDRAVAFYRDVVGLDLRSASPRWSELERGGGRVLKSPEDRPGEPIKLAHLSDTKGNGFTMSLYVG